MKKTVVFRETPLFEIGEFLLAGLFIGCAVSAFIVAAAQWARGDPWGAAEAAGLSLMFCGGCVHPVKYMIDCATFPFSFVEGSGRETPLTVFAGAFGLLLWGGSLLGQHWL